MVSSHNDLVPSNILFDDKRLWLIDWESAYSNDPLVDVAITLDNLASSSELESLLLKAWLGRAPDDALYGRLALIRALTRLYYAGVLLSASAAASGALADNDLSAPTLRIPSSDPRWAPQARDAGDQAHPGQDVPCLIFHALLHQDSTLLFSRVAAADHRWPWIDAEKKRSSARAVSLGKSSGKNVRLGAGGPGHRGPSRARARAVHRISIRVVRAPGRSRAREVDRRCAVPFSRSS